MTPARSTAAPAAEANQGLPARRRVRATRDFARIERRGRRFPGRFVVVIAARAAGVGRVGFTVSKKVGKAHERNLVKRRLREIMRRCKPLWHELDVVLIAKPEALGASYDALGADVVSVVGDAAAGKAPPQKERSHGTRKDSGDKDRRNKENR